MTCKSGDLPRTAAGRRVTSSKDHIPCIVIAGTHSGVGKTTIATALMAAFTRRGLRVQPFKIGPDFIDSGFHAAACGRHSHNLDGWMLSRNTNLAIFARAAKTADLAIVEGVMGLFDGCSACQESGSTAEVAKWLAAPVLLALDASAMARSAAAVVHGFESYDPALDLAGVLFNRIGGSKHAEILRDAVQSRCRAIPLGFLPTNEKIAFPNRHLGLVMASEAVTSECLAAMADWIEHYVNLDAVLELAGGRSPALDLPQSPARVPVANVRIGVARDAAFCFYYAENLRLLEDCGAELVEFSPIADLHLPPDLHGVYIGGGYPELHAAALSANCSMLQSIRAFAEAGAPVYAECGGFMYLTEAIFDAAGHEHAMAGIFPTRARMQSRLAALGYIQPEPVPTLWLDPAMSLRGHEFRYSKIDPMPTHIERVYRAPAESYRVGSVLGSYIHLHFLSCPDFAAGFVRHCAACAQNTPRRPQ
jgi:cobyrinic acid a,c-diamide synthase